MADDDTSGMDNRMIAAAVFVVIVAAAAILLYTQPGILQTPDNNQQPDAGDENLSDPFEDYASAGQNTGTTEGAESAPVAADITIQQFGVSPSRASGEVGDAFRWHNSNEFAVYLTFDRTDQEPTIDPDGTLRMRFNGITYYEVFRADNDERIARGSLYVE